MDTTSYSQYPPVTPLASNLAGYVYLSHSDKSITGQVVVKVIDSIRLEQEDIQKRFLKHVNTMKRQLSHPLIVPLLDAGIEEGHPYFVSEYMPQGSLDRRLAEHATALNHGEIVRILSRIGQALVHAHVHNILHGNLKPGNILFDARNMAYLADFNLLDITEQWDSSHPLNIHAACYMAPEQFWKRATHKSDQYALGCIAYEMLTGRVPFNGLSVATLRLKHTKELPIPPTSINPAIPAYIEAAILKALAKDPRERFESALAFVGALNDFTELQIGGSSLPQEILDEDPKETRETPATVPIPLRTMNTTTLLQLFPVEKQPNFLALGGICILACLVILGMILLLLHP